MDNIIVTTHEAFDDHETAQMAEGGSIAGYLVGECTVVCTGCVRESDENKEPIFYDSECDYPGASCDDCYDYLNTNLLVYKSQDPKLFWRLRMTEEVGNGWPDTECLSVEEIAQSAKEQAYELGYAEGEPVPDDVANSEILISHYTESAHYINNVAPKLRAMSGFEDSGHGTYQECPIDEAQLIYDEDVWPAFRDGWYDACLGRDFGHSME